MKEICQATADGLNYFLEKNLDQAASHNQVRALVFARIRTVRAISALHLSPRGHSRSEIRTAVQEVKQEGQGDGAMGRLGPRRRRDRVALAPVAPSPIAHRSAGR